MSRSTSISRLSPRARIARVALPALAALMLVAFGGAGGCAVHSSAAAGRLANAVPAPMPDSQWPGRSATRLEEALEELPEEVKAATPEHRVVDGQVVTQTVYRPVMRLLDGGIFGHGLVFRVEQLGTPLEPQDHPTISMKFMTFPMTYEERDARVHPAADLKTAEQAAPGVGPAATPAVSPQPTNLAMRRGDPWRYVNRGMWLRVDEPKHPKGLVIQLTSFGGARYEQPVVDEMIHRGWAVLRVTSPNLNPRRGTPEVEIDDDSDFDAAARQLGSMIDDRLAEQAYAAESGLAYLAAHNPEIPQHPLVIMGFSAGALIAPAVAARLDGQVDAAVLICGGANLLDISQRSELTNGGIQIKWGAHRGTAADIARLNGLYLAHSRLDPFHTAPYLARTPVLQVHGVFDGIVPADDGDLLYERLGHPERVVFPVGHKGVFWLLPGQADRLADWVEDTTAGLAPTDVASH